MPAPRQVPLVTSGPYPRSWNEQMHAGEYAVHYSSFAPETSSGLYCTVFASLSEASGHAREAVRNRPALKCKIYDHHGMVGAPLHEIQGSEYKREGEVSARFRRWTGSLLFAGGACLMLFDWWNDFRYTWPGTLGSRMLMPGLILLVTEALIVLHARRKLRPEANAS